MAEATKTVLVQIRGHQYPIKSQLDRTYVAELAGYLDEKMRTAADSTTAADTTRLAVLAALNIADDYFRCRDRALEASQDHDQEVRAHVLDEVRAALETRATALEALIDEVLAEAP